MTPVKPTSPSCVRTARLILFSGAVGFCLATFHLFHNIHPHLRTQELSLHASEEDFWQFSPEKTGASHDTVALRRPPHVGPRLVNTTSRRRGAAVNITMRVHQKQPIIFLWREMSSRFHQFEACPYDCLITSDMKYLAVANFVMIHAIDMRGYSGRSAKLPRSHPPHQYWVFVDHESPERTYMGIVFKYIVGHFEKSFNLMMTYMSEADIHIPYGEYRERDREHQEKKGHTVAANPENTNYGNVLVLWFVSHCDIPLRREYALQLNKHIKIDVLGYCTGRHDPCRLNKTCLQEFTRKYKFYLAFENSICKEYITEKFWKALRYGMVPIAFGASINDYQQLAPPNSFIHVDNFTSPEHLADYLKYLDKNHDVYNAYHTWREKYEIKQDGGWWWWSITRKYESGENGMWCKVCEKAHKIQGVKKQVPLTSKAWSDTKLCRRQTPSLYKFPRYTPDDRAWRLLGAEPHYTRTNRSEHPLNYIGRYGD